MSKILIIYLFSITSALCQTVPNLEMYWNFLDIDSRDLPQITIVVEKIVDTQLGRIRTMPDSSLEIAIDPQFYNFYGDASPQVNRLIYQLIGLQYHMRTRKVIMRPGTVYRRTSYRRVNRTFKQELKLHQNRGGNTMRSNAENTSDGGRVPLLIN